MGDKEEDTFNVTFPDTAVHPNPLWLDTWEFLLPNEEVVPNTLAVQSPLDSH